MNDRRRIANALLPMRLAVFLVILMWTIDKFVNPEHAAGVYENFYGLGGLGPAAFYLIGGLELVLLAAFVAGWRKTISYGLVLVIHAISTLSTWQQYLNPFEGPNLLFFAAIPMLAACWALFSLREYDTRWTIDGKESP